MKVNDGMKTKR